MRAMVGSRGNCSITHRIKPATNSTMRIEIRNGIYTPPRSLHQHVTAPRLILLAFPVLHLVNLLY